MALSSRTWASGRGQSLWAGMSDTATLARSGASTTRALVGPGNPPSQDLARAKGRCILLTTHLSGADEARSCLHVEPLGGLASLSSRFAYPLRRAATIVANANEELRA
jgi:hypothetical protein